MWIDLRGLKSQWNEYHTQGLVHRNHMQEKIKGNRPATSNGRENIHGNLPKCEWLTNNLWTIYEQFMNNLWTNYEQEPPGSLLQFQLTIVAQLFLSSCSPISLSFSFASSCFPLIRRFVVFLSGLLSHASVGLWTMHEQFMNSSWTKLDWLSWPTLGPNPHSVIRIWPESHQVLPPCHDLFLFP